jgi:hypothetical protein
MIVSDLIILSGLPGSGKTRYTERLKDSSFIQIFNFDNNPEPFKDYDKYAETYVFDGLFLTNDAIIKVINDFDNNAPGIWSIGKLEIHHWLEDREACLVNDSTRPKERSAAVTIKNAPFEYPDLDKIREGVRFEIRNAVIVEEHVYKVPDFNEKIINEFSEAIQSKEWCNGGTHRDYKGNYDTIEKEEPPKEFKELEEVLDKLTPEMTRKDYKEILRLIQTKEREERDYYGGVALYSWFEIDTRTLFKKLEKLGYKYEEDKN